jgi:acetyl esterase/lipase
MAVGFMTKNKPPQTTGSAMYAEWFSAYLVNFIIRNNAIAVVPNYRLTPEHTGNEILEDITSLVEWLKSSLPTYLASKDSSINADLSRVLSLGDSAGGWMALQSVLSLPENTFRACFVQYPVVNAIPISPDDVLFGERIPPKKELDDFIANIKPGTVVSAATPPARSPLMAMLLAHGRWDEIFGTGQHLMPETRIESAKFFVPTYIIHGKDDTIVPVKWTEKFVKRARELFPDTTIELVTRPGEHGFDDSIYEDEEPWLAEILRKVEKDWLE